jgi:DNA-binding transcriptional ArsR family regulator
MDRPPRRPAYRGIHGSVVAHLGERIVRGDIAPGELLDPLQIEHELGVSRTVVREALRVLTAKGLVDARPKRGTYVLAREHWSLLDVEVLAALVNYEKRGELGPARVDAALDDLLAAPFDRIPHARLLLRARTSTANLSAYDGPTDMNSILEEIYRQRTAELFLTGLRLEDSRRLGRPDPLEDDSERTRNFYPYPDQERLNNPNTPANPEI